MAAEKIVTGKTFLITGGASGLGALYAEAFLKEGAKKIAIVDINEEVGKATTARLNASSNKVIFIKCDVSNEQDIITTFDKVVKEFGQLDVLINNAGIMNDSPNWWRKASDVNWQGLVSFTMKALPHMSKSEGGAGGTIINVSSIAGLLKFKALPIYAGSKMAVLHFSTSLAMDPFLENTGVRVMTLCPGPTATPLMQGIKAKAYNDQVGVEVELEHQQISVTHPDQAPKCVVAACVKMFAAGDNGSVWLAARSREPEDITPTMDSVYKLMADAVFGV